MEKPQGLGTILQNIVQKHHDSPRVPDDALCTVCGRLLMQHPFVTDQWERPPLVLGCKCEEAKRARAAHQAAKWKKTGLPDHHSGIARTFETFDTSRHIALGGIVQSCRWFARTPTAGILVLVGMTGSGKSHLLESIGRHTVYHKSAVRYHLVAELLQKLRPRDSIGPELDVLDVANSPGVLLLDDLGMERPSDWVLEQLTVIVDHRYRTGKRLGVATNLTEKEFGDRMGARLASRIFDRINQINVLQSHDFRMERR